MQALPKPELIYLAGLFHDIAKGRGGDHSEMGAVDAEAFCLEQGLSRYDARLVAWLVRHHLVFSITAQKKDIKDPDVVSDFARLVGDQTHLDYLYLLSVADLRGTNPKLWNSWKSSLFDEFYEAAKRALRRGLENPIDKEELIEETQAAALALLKARRIRKRKTQKAWQHLTEEYFLRHTPEEITWHTEQLIKHGGPSASALVSVNQETARGGTAILVYTEYAQQNFARLTAVLDELGLNIVNAAITPTADGHSLDTYLVLENDGTPIDDPQRIRQIERAVEKVMTAPDDKPMEVTRQAPRQVRMFSTPTRITFSRDPRGRSLMELIAGDRPGLLSEVGKVLLSANVAIHTARIMTIGERAEDVFCISDVGGRPLGEAACDRLRDELQAALDQNQ
jgi:[protein-PII] uridylyltransferase